MTNDPCFFIIPVKFEYSYTSITALRNPLPFLSFHYSLFTLNILSTVLYQIQAFKTPQLYRIVSKSHFIGTTRPKMKKENFIAHEQNSIF